MDGVLVVDKPAGPTSHDVVARVRRALGVRRVGHTGTLDPFATGVLPLVVGRATRLARFLTAADKTYEATIRLGFATDTYDATGRSAGAPLDGGVGAPAAGLIVPDRTTIEARLADLTGTYPQAPPPFSAKKVDGVRAYVRARQGAPIEPHAVVVSAHEITLLSVDGADVRIRVRCSAGFYVRTLAHTLGEQLGVGAHLAALRRTRSSGFGLEEAVPLDAIEREGTTAARRLVPLAAALPHLEAVVLTASGVRRALHGMALSAGDLTGQPSAGGREPVRLLDSGGRLVGLARPGAAAGSLHPFVVIG